MSKAERRERNKRAHAIRRAFTDADYRQAKADGLTITWRQIADTYSAMSTDDVLALDLPGSTAPEVIEAAAPRRKRQAPAHVREASETYRLARAAWEEGLAEALRGARPDGKPARGEKYTDEERDYRDAHPAPVWADFMRQQGQQREDVAA